MSARKKAAPPPPILEGNQESLLDIVDHVLTKGIVISGDLVLGVADIDLVYLRLSAILCAADRILGPSASGRRRRSGRNDVFATRIGSLRPPGRGTR